MNLKNTHWNMESMTSNLLHKYTPPISDYLKLQSSHIENELQKLVPLQHTSQNQLMKAARYSLLEGGKRIRPILAIATAEVFGVPVDITLRPACALEMIHTYSLIHDDLPCMDDDDFRRGKPSLHKEFTEAHAVLTGDYLLTYAFETLSNDANLSANHIVKLVRVLAQNSGANGMIGGQMMDIESIENAIDLNRLQLIHSFKTGALILASIQFGTIIGNANKEHENALIEFGNNIGLAFQITDDILDVTKSTRSNNPNYSSDIKNHKTTYVSLLGIDQAKNKVNDLLTAAYKNLSEIPFPTIRLKEIAELICGRCH